MIVKIHLEEYDSGVFVYITNHDREVFQEKIASPDILQLLAGRQKAYFQARINGKDVELQKEIGDQGW